MNYIGSKYSLLDFLQTTIEKVTGYKSGKHYVFADLFAGTGVVGQAYREKGCTVIANDIQYYSYVLNKHIVENTSDVDSSQESSDESPSTKTVSSQSSPSKSWVAIGTYSGSGSGSKVIEVPAGEIRVDLSAYPIKNYATNHLYVTGSNGQSGGVDWGSTSAVETRSDSFSFTSSSPQTFTIDYYETVSWEVTFYRYQ